MCVFVQIVIYVSVWEKNIRQTPIYFVHNSRILIIIKILLYFYNNDSIIISIIF